MNLEGNSVTGWRAEAEARQNDTQHMIRSQLRREIDLKTRIWIARRIESSNNFDSAC